MSLFSFIKEAGEKLFGSKAAAATTPSTATSAEDFTAQATASIENYITAQKLDVTGVKVSYDATQSKITVTGEAATQAIKEKVTLCCGNISSITAVDNQMTVVQPEPEAQFHDVVRGDTLSAIAKKYYGDANKYPIIFEANKPMLSHPDKIYSGQKLRIPALA